MLSVHCDWSDRGEHWVRAIVLAVIVGFIFAVILWAFASRLVPKIVSRRLSQIKKGAEK
jgi:hypothetical protein